MAEDEEDPPVDPAVYHHCIALMLRHLSDIDKASKAKAKTVVPGRVQEPSAARATSHKDAQPAAAPAAGLAA
eukprot:6146601-Heterocapsa_arctica.AAC.1